MQILGGGMQIAGAALGASSASKRRKQLEKIAQTPGVDIGSVYSDTTKAGMQGLPGATDFASGLNQSALLDLTDILNQSIPGYTGLQTKRSGVVGSLLSGELPTDVASSVRRNAVSKAVAGGYGGSGAADNLVARDLGLTSLDLIGQGMRGAESLISTTPLPRITQASDVLNVTGRDTLGVRSGERSEKLKMLIGAANAPTSQDVWGKALTDMGGSMGGGGGGGGMGGMGGIGSILGILGAI